MYLRSRFAKHERGELSDTSTFHLDWQVNQKSAQRCCPDHRRSSFASGTRAPAVLLFYYRESSWNEPLPRGGFLHKKTGWNQRARLFLPSVWNSRKTESSILLMIRVEHETAELVITVLSAAPLVGIYQILGWVRRPGGVQGSPLTNLYEQESLQISKTKAFQVRHILKVHLHKRESEINTFFFPPPPTPTEAAEQLLEIRVIFGKVKLKRLTPWVVNQVCARRMLNKLWLL